MLKGIKAYADRQFKVLVLKVGIENLIQVPEYEVIILEITQQNNIYCYTTNKPEQFLPLYFLLMPVEDQETEEIVKKEREDNYRQVCRIPISIEK